MISRVNFTSFLSLRNLSLKFTPGLNVLSAPTGSGKSNVISGIGWCLFNSHWFGNQDNLVRWGSKLAEVEVFFDNGESVSRTRADGKSVLFVTEGKVKNNEYEYPKDRMWDLICSPQFSLTSWQSISPTQAKQHYERVFGLDIYEKYYRQSGGVLGDIKRRQNEIDGALSVLPEISKEDSWNNQNRFMEVCDSLKVAYKNEGFFRFGLRSIAKENGIELEDGDVIGLIPNLNRKENDISKFLMETSSAIGNLKGDICFHCGQPLPQEIIERNKEERQKLVAELVAGENELNALRDSIERAKSIDNDLSDVEFEIQELEEQKKILLSKLQSDDEVLMKRNKLTEEKETNAKKIDAFERARVYLRNAPQALSPDIAKFISSTASSLLRETDLSLMMQDDYNVIVYRDGRELGRQVSGGQAVLVGLALKLACMEAVQAIGVELPRLIILDEVTQGALDGDTAAVVPIMIRQYLDKGYQVIAVDHSGLWDSESANLIRLENREGVTVWV